MVNKNNPEVTTSDMDDATCVPFAPEPPAVPQTKDERLRQLRINRDREQEAKMKQKAKQFSIVGAIERRDLETVQSLIDDGVNVDAEIVFTKTPLTHAIDLGHEDVSLLLLDNGCDPSLCIDEFPNSQPIHLAAKQNLYSVVEKLIGRGADVNAWDADQMSAMTIACYYGNSQVIEVLLRHGADVNFRDSCYRTPLHRAVESDVIDVVSLLAHNGANINATDIKGWSPLHLAIALDHQNVAQFLLEEKCDVNLYDINNYTPLCISCDHLCRKNVDIVRQTQFSYDGRMIDFLQGRYLSPFQKPKDQREMLQLVVKLINSGANIDGHLIPPITIAAVADHADSLYILINSGAWIPHDWLVLSPDIQVGEKVGLIMDWLKSQCDQQYTLLWQCKRRIRKYLGTLCNYSNTIDSAIKRLQLPPAIKGYLQ